MSARMPFASVSRWRRATLVFACCGLTLFVSCTSSEDTEPFVPSLEGAKQPRGQGALLNEQDACARLLKSAQAAYKRLGCDAPTYPGCPQFIRPGGGSGCYEYFAESVAACEQAYGDAESCSRLAPCLATAELNTGLPTCLHSGTGGTSAGGAGVGPQGGASLEPAAGAGGIGSAGQPAGGAGN